MPQDIDLLVEKYTSSLKNWGHMTDIFVNPSRKEFNEVAKSAGEYGSVGFIADNTNNKIYVFQRSTIIHEQAWDEVKTDKRKLYTDSTVLTGELLTTGPRTKPKLNFNSFENFAKRQTIIEMMTTDWSYFDRWIPNLNKEIEKAFGSYKNMVKKYSI